MAYATAADVQALFNQLGGYTITFGAGTVPTLTEVTGITEDLSVVADTIMRGAGVTVPVTSTNGIALVGYYVAFGAACDAFGRAFMFDETPAKVAFWCDRWAWFLEKVEDGTLKIEDAAPRPKSGTFNTQRYTGY